MFDRRILDVTPLVTGCLAFLLASSPASSADLFMREVPELWFLDSTTLVWTRFDASDEFYSVYRTDRARLLSFDYGDSYATGVLSTQIEVPETPAPGEVHAFLVARTQNGVEGTIGFGSQGLVRSKYATNQPAPTALPQNPVLFFGFKGKPRGKFGEIDRNGDGARDIWDEVAAYANIIVTDTKNVSDPNGYYASLFRDRGLIHCKRIQAPFNKCGQYKPTCLCEGSSPPVCCSDSSCDSNDEHLLADEWRCTAAGFSCVVLDEIRKANISCNVNALKEVRNDFNFIISTSPSSVLQATAGEHCEIAGAVDLHLQQVYQRECRTQPDTTTFQDFRDARDGLSSDLRHKTLLMLSITQDGTADDDDDVAIDFLDSLDRQMHAIKNDPNLGGLVDGVAFWKAANAKAETLSQTARLSEHYFLEGHTTRYGRRPIVLQDPSFEEPSEEGFWARGGGGNSRRSYLKASNCPGGSTANPCDPSDDDDLATMEIKPWFHYRQDPNGQDETARYLGRDCASDPGDYRANFRRMIRGAGSIFNTVSQIFQARPSTEYIVSVTVQSGDPNLPTSVGLSAYDYKSPIDVTLLSTIVVPEIPSDRWVEARLAFSTPPATDDPDGTDILIEISDQPSGAFGVLYLDFVQILPLHDLEDASFEDAARGWTLNDRDGSGPGKLEIVDLMAEGTVPPLFLGQAGIKITKGAIEWNELSIRVDVEPLTEYEASCWVRRGAGVVHEPRARLNIRDTRSNSILNKTTVERLETDAWVQIKNRFLAGSSTHEIRFAMEDYNEVSGQVYYADYCRLIRVDDIGVPY